MSEEAKAVPAKKSKGRLLLILVAVLVVLGGGGAGAFWWMSRGGDGHDAKDGKEKAQEGHDDSHSTPISLPTFTVNLADKDTSRYLRTTVTLVVPTPEAAEEIQGAGHGGGSVKLMKARSAILELLSTKTADELTTPEGKDALKKEIAQRASKAFGAVEVNDVLFSEFVVQF